MRSQRRIGRTIGGGLAALAITAGLVGCSSDDLDEVQMTIVSSTPAETSASETTTQTTSEMTAETTTETTSPKKDVVGEDAASISKRDGYFVHVSQGGLEKEASFPACDGRNILILMSVIDEHGAEATYNELAQAVLTGGPADKKFTVPGKCASLRKTVNGNVIYPVYLDFGSDEAGMCAAKARYGGNGRTLNNSGDFHDPC